MKCVCSSVRRFVLEFIYNFFVLFCVVCAQLLAIKMGRMRATNISNDKMPTKRFARRNSTPSALHTKRTDKQNQITHLSKAPLALNTHKHFNGKYAEHKF